MPRFCVLAARQSMGERIPPERWEQVVERGQEEMDRLLTTDGAPQRFADPLRFNAGAYGLGSAPSRATLAVDIPLAALRRIAGLDSVRTSLRWQVRIRSRDGTWPVSSEFLGTVALPASVADPGEGGIATLIREYPLPPGTYDLRLVLSDSAGTTGAMYSRDGMVVLGGTDTGISDLVLMPTAGQGASRNIEGVPVQLAPTFTAGPSPSVDVGYVLQGFAGVTPRVTVEIRKLDSYDDDAALALTFDEQPGEDRQFFVRRIDVSRLGNGAYDVTLPDGSIATRTKRMLVRR